MRASARLRASLLVLAAPAWFLAGTAGAAAADAPTLATEQALSPTISVSSTGWVRYQSQLAASGVASNVVRVTGTTDADGGCGLPGAGSAAVGDTSITYI